MKENVLYTVFGLLSFAILIAAGFLAGKVYKEKERGKRVLSALHIFTLGVFAATVLVFVPVYYVGYDFGDSFAVARPFLISVHHALRVFILDGEFDAVRNAVAGLGELPHILFSLYAALLYVLAPLLTFSNVLSLFKNARNEFLFSWKKKSPFYIFSELNEMSITMAESIKKDKEIKKPVIVFTDVFERDEEEDYELRLRAHDVNAILLKKDITRINVKAKKARVEFFLIGKDESENMEQAIKLTEEYKNDCAIRPIAIFVFSNKPSAGYILDSLDKGKYTLDKTLEASIKENPWVFLEEKLYSEKTVDSGFYLRRIDCVEMLVQQVLKRTETVDAAFEDNAERRFSFTILGMGSYGKEFLKQALSTFQFFGYKVEVNVFDASFEEKGGKKNLLKRLGQEWPEIITDTEPRNRAGEKDEASGYEVRSFVKDVKGDSCYDIRFFDGVDCFSSDFDRLFEAENETGERLRRTRIAFVALGEDDKNIDAAVMLRTLFERLCSSAGDADSSKKPKKPLIYSVVYDDRKAANLTCNQGRGIVNYRGEPLGIDFIGNLGYQYSYDRIREEKKIEDKALRYHLDWTRRDAVTQKNRGSEDTKALGESIIEKTKGYMDYEYYRKSSVARATHEELLAEAKKYLASDSGEGKPDHPAGCTCEDCAREAVSEHMRWNMYMRTLGYRYSPNRNDIAKQHNDLKAWKNLDSHEKKKDS